MRHLGSLVLSLFLGALTWILVVAGFAAIGEGGTVRSLTGDILTSLIGLAALLGAGLAYSALVLPRLSPVGPAIVGLLFLVVSIWAVVDEESFQTTFFFDSLDMRMAWWAAATGPVSIMAVPLLATLVSPRRWRRSATARPVAAPPSYPAAAGAPYPPPQAAAYWPAAGTPMPAGAPTPVGGPMPPGPAQWGQPLSAPPLEPTVPYSLPTAQPPDPSSYPPAQPPDAPTSTPVPPQDTVRVTPPAPPAAAGGTADDPPLDDTAATRPLTP